MQQDANSLFADLLNKVVSEVSQETLSETQQIYDYVVKQPNAYTCSGFEPGPGPNRWNMITYKKGQRSQL